MYLAPMTDTFRAWIDAHDDVETPLIPAATVLLVRDTVDGLETLMMRRNSRLSFAEGMWVFPGGRIDPDDHPDDGADERLAARNAAVREAKEEADLDIEPDALVQYSHWIPPRQAPKRFSTWFFLAPAPSGDVTVDRGEILEHAWWRPADALQRVADRRIEILPPTWMSLHDMSAFETTTELFEAVVARGVATYATRMLRTALGPAAVWDGDAAFQTGDADAEGPRHRLVMTDGEWLFEQR